MENPWLIKAILMGGALITLLILAVLDRLLINLYARRLGVRLVRNRARPDRTISLPRINVATIAGTTRLLLVVIATAWFVGRTTIRAQSHDEAEERKFAAQLSRRAHLSTARPARPSVARPTVRKVEKPQSAASTVDAARFGMPHISQAMRGRRGPTGESLGMAAATPVNPSGYGTGRDAFVESLYPQILGRNAQQNEVDYWSRALARGGPPEAVAQLIWNSREHRSLIRNHEAPGIPFTTAYQTAYAVGLKNKQK
jgi:hypothetical protein